MKFPLIYNSPESLMLGIIVNKSDILKILPSKQFKPLSIIPNKTLLCITFFNYSDSIVGPYREIAISVPVIKNGGFNLPVLPIFFPKLFSSFGFYALKLLMSSRDACTHSEEIFGYNTSNKLIDFKIKKLGEKVEICVYEPDTNRVVLTLQTVIPRKFKESNIEFRTYTNDNLHVDKKINLVAKAIECSRFLPTNITLNVENSFFELPIRSNEASNNVLFITFYREIEEKLGKPEIFR